MINLFNKRVVLAVSGGIAAYKSAELCRLLQQAGADVQVIMTEHAKEFIRPLTFQALTGRPVRDTLLDAAAEQAMGHIELARWADVIVVAPATANCLAKLAQGVADDLLSTVMLASQAHKMVAPAMNQQMWHDPATQNNVELLAKRGVHILGPDAGAQACGDVGLGRLLAPQDIVTQMGQCFTNEKFAGKRVIITSGPTHEAIDPVRYIGNRSSGKMGAALSQACLEAGAKVTVITGPVNIHYPERADVIDVTSADEMLAAVLQHVREADIFIACAAVADYRVNDPAPQKIKKSAETLVLNLIKNPDILSTVCALSKRPLCIGFAAESENVIENGRKKLRAKQCDYVIANDISQAHSGFAVDDIAATILTEKDNIELALASKAQIAREIVNIVATRSFL